jgi:translation initiation factor 2 beta subunit (eIF-2beta)/eIF-5
LKKKKKKKPAKATEADDFEAKLASAGINENDEAVGDAEKAAPEEEVVEGDMVLGTGIWSHDEVKPIKYDKLLERFFAHLHSAHPDLLSSGSKSYVIPPPQCLREGNKKTIFANIPDICKRMKRSEEHVMQFIFAELGTSGSVDGSRRLVIKGRFQQKQIENVLRRYIGECQCPQEIEHVLTSFQANMSPAKPAVHQTQSSAKERTVYTSSPATPAEVGEVLLPLRRVTQLKSARERGSRHERLLSFIHSCMHAFIDSQVMLRGLLQAQYDQRAIRVL